MKSLKKAVPVIVAATLAVTAFVAFESAPSRGETLDQGDRGYVAPFSRGRQRQQQPEQTETPDEEAGRQNPDGSPAGGSATADLAYDLDTVDVALEISYAHHRQYPYRRYQYRHHIPYEYYGYPYAGGFEVSLTP